MHSNPLPVWWGNWRNQAQVLTSVLDVSVLLTLWAIKPSLYYQKPLGRGRKKKPTSFAATKHLQNGNSPNLPWREQMRVRNGSGEIAARLRQQTCYFQPRGCSCTCLWSQNWGERTSEHFYFLRETQAEKKKETFSIKMCALPAPHHPVFALFNEKAPIPTPIVNLTRPTVAVLWKKPLAAELVCRRLNVTPLTFYTEPSGTTVRNERMKGVFANCGFLRHRKNDSTSAQRMQATGWWWSAKIKKNNLFLIFSGSHLKVSNIWRVSRRKHEHQVVTYFPAFQISLKQFFPPSPELGSELRWPTSTDLGSILTQSQPACCLTDCSYLKYYCLNSEHAVAPPPR